MNMSGMEMMLRSLGLGDILEAAKKMASEQTIEKIVQFADRLETLNIEQINDRLAAIEQALGVKSVIEPGSGSRNGITDLAPTGPLNNNRSHKRSGGSVPTGSRAHSHNSGTTR